MSDENTRALTRLMTHISGPLLAGDILSDTLGYGSDTALRKAASRDTVPVKLMDFPNRRLRFSLSHLVAEWLIEQRLQHSETLLDIPEIYGIDPPDDLKLFVLDRGYLLHEKDILELLNLSAKKIY